MKKVIPFFCTIFCALQLQAQDASTRIEETKTTTTASASPDKVHFGLQVQPGISWIKPQDKFFKGNGSRMAISGGLFMEKNITSRALFHIGLSITQMGGVVVYDSLRVKNSGNTVTNVEYTYKTRYVELPIAIKLITEDIGYIAYYGEVGISPGLLWKARADVSPGIFPNTDEYGNEDRNINGAEGEFVPGQSVVEDDDIKSFRLPLMVGAGVEYAVTEATRLIGGLRYNSGIINIMGDKRAEAFNSYVSLFIGVKF